ncbi:hypothetical protein C8R43DRAFT_696053 [Mycena crocata]|nr:hypothetical protein C8R43DRAFT_696053 [Mycena crocata]
MEPTSVSGSGNFGGRRRRGWLVPCTISQCCLTSWLHGSTSKTAQTASAVWEIAHIVRYNSSVLTRTQCIPYMFYVNCFSCSRFEARRSIPFVIHSTTSFPLIPVDFMTAVLPALAGLLTLSQPEPLSPVRLPHPHRTHRFPSATMSSGKEPPHVVIIGAGIGGLTMGIKLRRMGFSNFTIIEKAGEVGGTWRDNIYPGCSSDVPIHVYSLSTDLNPNWTHSHAFQPDIQQYWLQLAHKYELYSNIIFHRTVTSAEWDPRTQKYNILTRDRDGNKIPLSAAILVSATGLLEVPKFPDFPGVSQFRGHTFHSARWDSAVSLEGKRVAVIGGGPSAIQFVPIISQDPSVKIVQYCRSPNWIHPSVRQEYSPTQKWLFRHVPLYLRLFRDFLFFRAELMYLLIFGSHATNASIEQKVKAYMVKNTPTRYLNEIIPDYKLGSKRIVYDWNYLAALVRPNLTLVRDPIVSITENGICTKEGAEAAFDVIIFSTGYITVSCATVLSAYFKRDHLG